MNKKALALILGGIMLISILGILAVVYTQGTFFSPSGCQWEDITNPATGDSVYNMDQYKQELKAQSDLTDEQIERHISRFEFRNTDDDQVMQFKLPNCGSEQVQVK